MVSIVQLRDPVFERVPHYSRVNQGTLKHLIEIALKRRDVACRQTIIYKVDSKERVMQTSRRKRAVLDDAALALLFERCHYDGSERFLRKDACASVTFDSAIVDSLLFGISDENLNKTARGSIAMTTMHALAQEVRNTEQQMRGATSANATRVDMARSDQYEHWSSTDRDQVCCVPALHDLEELMNELYDVYDRDHDEEQSHAEREYAQALLQAIVMALTQATIVQHSHHSTGKQDSNELVPLGEVRVWLLEMVVRPSALSRQLAFTLFLNLSIATTSILLATIDETSRLVAAEQMQTRLFRVLMEMLTKAAIVAASSSDVTLTGNCRDSHTWIEQAVGCFLMFTKQGGRGYRADRLNAVDPQILRFLLHEISSGDTNTSTVSPGNIELADQLVELLVFTIYAQEGEVEQHSLLLPVTAVALVDRFGGLDLLLFHFYNTQSLSAKRLLLAVFFDTTYANTMRKSLESPTQQTASSNNSNNRAGYDQLWRYFVEWDLAMHLALTPGLFTAGSTTRTIKKLYASSNDWVLSETQVQHFFNQLRILIHVDEYYAQSSVLKNTIQLLRDQEAHNVTEVLMTKITQLLNSNRIEDKFQGERWLAELITYGLSCEEPSSSKSNNSFLTRRFFNNGNDQLSESVVFSSPDGLTEESMLAPLHPETRGGTDMEETCCFDEDANIRIAAGSKFWELAKSSSPAQRESFVRILTTFVRRRLRSKNSSGGSANLIHEINICLNMMQQQRESHSRVLVPLVMLVLDICKRKVSYPDKQKQRYDRNCTPDSDHYRQTSWHSDSLASRFVDGTIALDSALLKLFPPEFFVYSLAVLHVQVHPPQSCRQGCCGKVARSLIADVIVCTAMIVAEMPVRQAEANSNSMPEDVIAKLIPLMNSCDTRVAIIVAKCIMSTLKHVDMDKYQQILCDLHAVAVEEDDEARLASSYLFAQELLAKWVHSSS
ncbi:hypothetical protein FI667_g14147, partial [Globisporangium splendens]